MSQGKKADLTRRAFLASATLTGVWTFTGAAAQPNTAKVIPRKLSPNEKINCAAIGAGGKGMSDINACRAENIVALCDVDWLRAEKTFSNYPDAQKFKDYRNMLEKVKDTPEARMVIR